MDTSSSDKCERVYAAELVGVEGSECPIPKCDARGRQLATGWMEMSDLGWWLMEFACPKHGPGLGGGGTRNRMIFNALKSRGLSTDNAPPMAPE